MRKVGTPYLPSNGLIPLLSFYKQGFGYEYTMKVDVPLNKDAKSNKKYLFVLHIAYINLIIYVSFEGKMRFYIGIAGYYVNFLYKQ